MKKNIYLEVHQHQLVFWLGVLAGAVVISLIFFYRLLSPGDYKSFTLNPVKTTIQQIKKSTVSPKLNVAPKSGVKQNSQVKKGVKVAPLKQVKSNATTGFSSSQVEALSPQPAVPSPQPAVPSPQPAVPSPQPAVPSPQPANGL